MKIIIDDLKGDEIKALLQEHLADMLSTSPPESVHTLDINALRGPDITFWSLWVKERLAGCCALKEIDDAHGEIKTLRTSRSHLRQGIATKLLSHILKEAQNRSYTKISLETGSMDAFIPSRALYERFGFNECGPFDKYRKDPNNLFMTKNIQETSK